MKINNIYLNAYFLVLSALSAVSYASTDVELATQASKGNEITPDSSWVDRLEYVEIAIDEPGYHVWGSSPVIRSNGNTHLYVASGRNFTGGKGTYSNVIRINNLETK